MGNVMGNLISLWNVKTPNPLLDSTSYHQFDYDISELSKKTKKNHPPSYFISTDKIKDLFE